MHQLHPDIATTITIEPGAEGTTGSVKLTIAHASQGRIQLYLLDKDRQALAWALQNEASWAQGARQDLLGE